MRLSPSLCRRIPATVIRQAAAEFDYVITVYIERLTCSKIDCCKDAVVFSTLEYVVCVAVGRVEDNVVAEILPH